MDSMTPSAKFNPVTASEKTATFFEVYRKPISFAIGALFVAVLFLSDAPHPLGLHIVYDILGVLLVSVAALGRIWCAIYIAGHKNSQLTTDGPYSISRNPLYVFSLLGIMGICLFAHLALLTIVAAGVFLFYYHFVIKAEENRLASFFGKDYQDYLKSTPKFWPNFSLFHTRESFSIKPKLLLRALSEVVWFLLAIALLEFIEMLHDSGVLPTLIMWMF